MPGELVLDVLTPNDGVRLRRIMLVALEADPDAFLGTAESEATLDASVWTERLHDSRERWLVAVADGQDRGVANIRPAGTTSDMELHSVWVSTSLRGRGVARRMVTALVDFADQARVTGVRLWVADANTSAASLYQSLGFERTGLTGAVKHPAHERRLPLRSS